MGDPNMARKPSDKPWLHGASGWWCATIDGKRKKLDRDEKAAQRKLKVLRKLAKRGGVSSRDWLDATFSELADEYLDHVKATKQPGTYRSFRYGILRALKILGSSLRICEMRKFHVAKIHQELAKAEYSPTTIKDTITTVRQVLNWAVENEYIDSSPVPRYREKPQARQRSRTITKDEFKALLRHTDRPFRRFLITLLRTGCRPGELRSLIWEWVDLEQGLWIIPEHKTITRMKKPRPRIIPLPRTALMMCRWLARKPHAPEDHVFLNARGKPYTKDCLVEKMSRLRERAGITMKGGERLVLYSARHTFGTETVGKIGDIELAELMGHSDLQMTRHYTHLNAERLRDIQRRAQRGHA
jgi:integrase/recombinase XerD